MCKHTQAACEAAQANINRMQSQIESLNSEISKAQDLSEYCTCMQKKFATMSEMAESCIIASQPIDKGNFSNYSSSFSDMAKQYDEQKKNFEEKISRLQEQIEAQNRIIAENTGVDCAACTEAKNKDAEQRMAYI